MATTAAGTPYVESSDLVANYPGVSLALANHIDTIGKVLQVVRATDVTQRSTTSTSFVDVPGMSVSITPQKSNSNLLIIAVGQALSSNGTGDNRVLIQITDSANTALSGAQSMGFGRSASPSGLFSMNINTWGWVAAASTATRTYKLRFRVPASGLGYVSNNDSTGQIFAIEVAA